MILHFAPDAPALLHAAASAVLVLHIGGGSVGLLSGAAALLLRKGGRLHRLAGNVFTVAMLIMATFGAAAAPLFILAMSVGISPAHLAPDFPQWANTFMGIFVFYLVCTGWASVRLQEGLRRFEIGGFLFAVCAAATSVTIGLYIARSPTGLIDGLHYLVAYAFAVFFGLTAIADLTVVLRGSVSGAQRIARHLWRMNVPLLIACGSFFIGQPQLFPAAVRASRVLFLPEIVVLGLLIFWLLRVGFSSRLRGPVTPLAHT